MRNVFVVLSGFFVILGIVFAVLPMGTIGLLPAGLALVFALVAFFISEGSRRKFPKVLAICSGVLILAISIRAAVTTDEVAQDTQFEQKKVEAKQQDVKELEELEGDLK